MDKVIATTLLFICLSIFNGLLLLINTRIRSTLWAKKATWILLWASIFGMAFTLGLLSQYVGDIK